MEPGWLTAKHVVKTKSTWLIRSYLTFRKTSLREEERIRELQHVFQEAEIVKVIRLGRLWCGKVVWVGNTQTASAGKCTYGQGEWAGQN